MIKKLGIMGGTFDPIHYGHLFIAEEARFDFFLEKVLFIPSGQPPHKKGYHITSTKHRMNMVKLAIKDNSFFEASSLEVDRPGPSYAVDTLHAVRGIYPGAELFFISGADAILEILTWHRLHEVMSLCSFIAATRPGYSLSELNAKLTNIPADYRMQIFPLEIPGMAISSTALRERIKNERPVKYLLPAEVETYIVKNNLYKYN